VRGVEVSALAQPSTSFHFLSMKFGAPGSEGLAYELALECLKEFIDKDDPIASQAGAREALTDEIIRRFPVLYKKAVPPLQARLDKREGKGYFEALTLLNDRFFELQGDLLAIDALFADHVEAFGSAGQRCAKEVREGSRFTEKAQSSIEIRAWSKRFQKFRASPEGMKLERDSKATMDGLSMGVSGEDLSKYISLDEERHNGLAQRYLAVVGDPPEPHDLFSHWLGKGEDGKKRNHLSTINIWFAQVLWADIVRPSLKERSRENTIAPSSLITSLRDGRRDGGLTIGPWGKDGTHHIAVIPPKGIALFLPFDADVVPKGSKGTVSLRQTLTGYQMRLLLAAWTAWLDEGRDSSGKFKFDENIFLGEYLGLKHIDRTDQKGLRFNSTTTKTLRSSFAALGAIHVKSIGDIEASEAEPLIQKYHQKSTGKHLWYRHSPLLLDALHEHYTQFPRAVLRQDAKDASLSVGMASFVREKATVLMKHNGTHEAPLSYWLEKAGEDQTEGKRKFGNAYFLKASEKLKKAIQEGEVGSFSGVGDSAASLLTFTADTTLLGAYEPLKKAQAKRINAARIGEAIAIANAKKAKG